MAFPGKCADQDPEIWFPLSDKASAEVELAKSICRGCPIRVECLDRAIRIGASAGIWGGFTDVERRQYTHNQMRRIIENETAYQVEADKRLARDRRKVALLAQSQAPVTVGCP